MKRKSAYKIKIFSVACAIALLLCSCETESPSAGISVTAQEGKGIEIVGGKPGGLGLLTRSPSQPDRDGYCMADRMKIWLYRGVSSDNVFNPIKSESLNKKFGEESFPVDYYSAENSMNKIAYHRITAIAESYYNGYGIPAMAYSAEDEPMFFYTDSDKGYVDLGLELTGVKTPELYFGRLTFERNNTSGKNTISLSSDGLFSTFYQTLLIGGGSVEFNDCPLTGTLYRIVSQLNVKITGVDSNVVKKLEMYLSNVPDRMTLFGQHGKWYTVAEASRHAEKKEGFPVAMADSFPDNTVQLSTFLLPSHIGRKLIIRVYYVSPYIDPDGEMKEYEDFEITPGSSAFLTGDDAEVYWDNADEAQKHGSNELFVYDATANLYYSYSNVRVNISGEYDKVFTDKSDVAVGIEVCPAFEDSHTFEIDCNE